MNGAPMEKGRNRTPTGPVFKKLNGNEVRADSRWCCFKVNIRNLQNAHSKVHYLTI